MPDRRYFSRYTSISAILLAAAFTRLWGLSAYMPTMDEIQFLIISQGESLSAIAQRALAEVHPPLVWFLRHLLLLFSPDLFVQRLFSVVAGLFTILSAYQLGKCVYGNRHAGLVCALLLGFSPAAVIASMGLRNYVFFLLFLVMALYFLHRWLTSRTRANLLLYIFFIGLCFSSHFSGLMVAAALATGTTAILFKERDWRAMWALGIGHLPLAILCACYYHAYFAPGTTIPMWKQFALVTGFTPEHPDRGILAQIVVPVLAYFSPFLAAVHHPGLVPEPLLPLAQAIVLVGGVAVLIAYFFALRTMRHTAPYAFQLTLWMWATALVFSVTDLYPLSGNRHSLCMLPFFVLPFGACLKRPAQFFAQQPAAGAGVLLCAVAMNQLVIWADEDFCLTRKDYAQGREFLHSHIQSGDVIVTSLMGAYVYLIYDTDQGKTGYQDYGDKPYFKDTILLAPFGSPYKPFSSWRPFREDLARRLKDGTIEAGSRLWFVQYGWKNQELWTLMECADFKPLMEHPLSLNGVAIFSVRREAFASFMADSAAWERCYRDYSPLIVGTPFQAVTLK